jgi:hypothetical protein
MSSARISGYRKMMAIAGAKGLGGCSDQLYEREESSCQLEVVSARAKRTRDPLWSPQVLNDRVRTKRPRCGRGIQSLGHPIGVDDFERTIRVHGVSPLFLD